jgi:hypothetical protein
MVSAGVPVRNKVEVGNLLVDVIQVFLSSQVIKDMLSSRGHSPDERSRAQF